MYIKIILHVVKLFLKNSNISKSLNQSKEKCRTTIDNIHTHVSVNEEELKNKQ